MSGAPGTVTERPAGLIYHPDLLDAAEEAHLLRMVEGLDYRAITMRGQTALRTVRLYGYDYDYESGELRPGDPLPTELTWLRDRCAELAGVAATDLVQALVSRYPAGAGIGWHRDAPMFGSGVIGVSLLSACRMRFQRRSRERRLVYAVDLEPRSGYVLSGSARWAWQHSIPATKALRYSVTFRSLRRDAAPA
jgi:alkylated DNA repair protein (DNA oxidative demethylase)